jgi:monovalent cation/proton antiporter MnhG/PhaG subunit
VDVSAAAAVLLGIAVAAVLLSAIGVLVSRNVYQRLHYLAPAATVGVAATAAAIVVQEGLDQAGIKAVVTGALLFVVNPILTHATARAARVHQRGRWEEDVPR